MDVKLGKLLYFLTRNARVTTKELGKEMNCSQQSASYLINKLLEEKKILNYQIVVDPAKFGLITIVVLFNYSRFNKKVIAKMLTYLKNNPYVTFLEEVSQGADLLVEYCVPNLSLFNKQNREFLQEFKDYIKLTSIYPVVVRHIYDRKYLIKKPHYDNIILSGDRDIINLNNNQKEVLKILKKNPKETIANISNKIKIDPKTAIKIKKSLEKNKVIRKYSIVSDHESLGIEKKYGFIQLDYEDPKDITKFIEYCKQHPHIKGATKILGTYEIIITIEELNTKKTIKELRKRFNISDYRLIESEQVLKSTWIPDSLFE